MGRLAWRAVEAAAEFESTMPVWEQVFVWVVYVTFLAVFAFRPQILGLGRPLLALLAAAVLVFLQDVTPGPSQDLVEDINYDILMYLFGLMIISHYVELTGLVRVPNALFKWALERHGPYALIWALSLFTGLVAMFFTNDMAVFLLTPIVVRLTTQPDNARHLEGASFIFLMIISTTANIASAMSPIGNPQNVLVASISGLGFGTFYRYLALGVSICWALNTTMLCLWFYRLQRQRKHNASRYSTLESGELVGGGVSRDAIALTRISISKDDGAEEEVDISDSKPLAGVSLPPPPPDHIEAHGELLAPLPTRVSNALSIVSALIFLGWILLVTILDVYLGWATALAALLVVVLHALAHVATGRPMTMTAEATIFRHVEVVDYGLLFMFWANFALIGALLDTGWPQAVFRALLGSVGDAMVELWLVVVFVLAVVIASNILTNVPVVLLLAPLIAGLSDPRIGWLLVAFSTTVAGNLTLVGSACNLIVDARSRAMGGPELTFMGYFWYGFPSTLLLAFVGMLVIVGMYSGAA